MAGKRKQISLGLASLYDDLDVTSNSVEKDGDRDDEADDNVADNHGAPSLKKMKNYIDTDESSKQPANESNFGAACSKTVFGVCGWRKGERDEMQDAHVLKDVFEIDVKNVKNSAFYAIFDGHAGRRASEYAAKYLPERLLQKLSACSDVESLERNMRKIFISAYKMVDEQYLIEARKIRPSWKDGTTATTILLVNDTVYCANIGDSRAVVCRKKSDGSVVPLQLTVDHSPVHFEERMRIQKAGGNVKDGRVMGILEVSRSIGDGQFKAHGIICTPDVKKFSVTPSDWFIIMACDGLWKSFSNKEAVEFVVSKAENSKKVSTEPMEKVYLNDPRFSLWENIASDLAAESVRRGCGDNVSVIIIMLSDDTE